MEKTTEQKPLSDDELRNQEITCPISTCAKKSKISEIIIVTPWIETTSSGSWGSERSGGWLFPWFSPVECPHCKQQIEISKFAEKDVIYAAANREVVRVRRK